MLPATGLARVELSEQRAPQVIAAQPELRDSTVFRVLQVRMV